MGVLSSFMAETTPAAVQTFVGVAPSVSSISFETGEQVDMTVVPVLMGFRSSRVSLRAVFPYLDVSADTPAYRIGGPILGITIPEQRFEEHGPGDVVLTPALLLVQGGLDSPSLWGSLRIKTPTADETKYLGTGQLDYAPGLGLLAPFGTRFVAMGSVRYNIRGNTPEVEYDPVLSATAGTVIRVGDLEGLTVFVARGDSSVEGREATKNAGLSWFHPLRNGSAFTTSAIVGAAEDARIYGIAIGYTFNDGPFDWGG